MSIDFSSWTAATGNLSPTQQRAFQDVLTLVSEGKSHLAYGADYNGGKPCLVNHVGHMLTVGGGEGIPSAAFGALVGAFDRTNAALQEVGVNTEYNFVSPLAADVLLSNFAELKPVKSDDAQWEAAREQVTAPEQAPYVEPTDDEFNGFLLTMSTDIDPDGNRDESQDGLREENFDSEMVRVLRND